jgi:response regulator RpfG family c-di-GMP phosphodiesterase/tRNA A-37 threonylcarbamoyl transferase component Bud32
MNFPTTIGKYQIQGVLGQGGMGTVYKAFDPQIQRTVAIKTVLKSSMDPADLQYALTRFRHEAQAVGRLNHSRIAAIYDYGEEIDIAYIVMEIVTGKSLFQHMQSSARFDLREIGEIVRQLLDGLGYAHAQGVIHRDIKPSNVLVTDEGRIKLTDFGIARLDTSKLTNVGEVMGSPGYMSPEQFLGTEVDARSDLYSVGIIAYELLTGKRPFTGSDAEVMRQVLNDQPANPSEHNPKISAQLDWSLQKVLAKKRDDRFQNAKEFLDAFVKGIEASIRHNAPKGMSATIAEATTQRMDQALVQAARALAGAPSTTTDARRPAAAPAVAPAPAAKKARILFVDDEERILNALRSLFRRDYHVFTAINGAEALEFVTKFKPQVVVSDQRMREMTGIELLRQVREISPNSVRMLLTGYSDLAAIVGSINDGEVFRYISKPWDNDDIQRIVAEAVAIALELGDVRAAPGIVPDPMRAGILVIDEQQDAYRATDELFGTFCPVVSARGIDDAFNVLQRQEIALILADVGKGDDEITTALKLLKQVHPEILVIALVKASDSELVIELINEAQVFRLLNRPLDRALLKQHIQSALTRYQAYKQAPQLLHQHRVAPVRVADESTTRRMLERMRSLKNWLGQDGK